MTATATDPITLARRYFETWNAGDFDGLRAVLHDDCTFRGPLGEADGGDECAAGVKGLNQRLAGVEVVTMAADGPEVLSWTVLRTNDGKELPVCNWSHVEDGLITRIRVTFDPRPMLDS